MELIKNNISLKTNNGEIISIKYKDTEILYQQSGSWKKTFPIIFPVLGFSDGFEIENKNYQIPKHGFWKELNFETFVENENIVLSTIYEANEVYPFTIDIQQFISIKGNEVIIETKISNISKSTAYFHFGLHPAFNIDSKSKWIYKSNDKPFKIDLNGKLASKHDLKLPFVKESFGKDFDTLVYKNVDTNKGYFNYKDLKITIKHDAKNLQIWKPENDNFICIEPWYGANDREDKLIKEAKLKKYINKIKSGETWSSKMIIKITKNTR